VEQWVSCAQQLHQWDLLQEYAFETQNHELMLDHLWRAEDWPNLKACLTGKTGQVGDLAF
jgi:transformation/transcription domain-associated protein